MKELTPREITRELDRYIIGQHEAKRAVGAVEITELTVEQAIKAALVQLMG